MIDDKFAITLSILQNGERCGLVGSVQICVFGDGVQGKGSPSPASAIQKLGSVGFRLLFCSDNAAHPVRMVADEVFWLQHLTPDCATILSMNAYPEFMKHPANRILRSNQATPGVEGYVFDGEDGSQMAFWTCSADGVCAEHVHDYDEYMLVVQGCYTLVIHGSRTAVKAGEEYFIPRGVPHSGEVAAGTRTIHAFGGHRADRERF
jgi:quercetin dioxygenase-like cupin family protein